MTTSKLKPRLVVEYNHIGQFRSGVRKKAWAAIRMSAIKILSNTVAITPWKTGNLRDSYTVVEDEANFVVYVGTFDAVPGSSFDYSFPPGRTQGAFGFRLGRAFARFVFADRFLVQNEGLPLADGFACVVP